MTLCGCLFITLWAQAAAEEASNSLILTTAWVGLFSSSSNIVAGFLITLSPLATALLSLYLAALNLTEAFVASTSILAGMREARSKPEKIGCSRVRSKWCNTYNIKLSSEFVVLCDTSSVLWTFQTPGLSGIPIDSVVR